MSTHWYTYPNVDNAAEACARHMLVKLEQALAGQGTATLAVSGGETPRLLFNHLARSGFNWQRVHLFWVDERVVPSTDAESNYRLADEHFLKPARFPHRNVHRIQGQLRPDDAAQQYAKDIEEFFGLSRGQLPQFDLIQLGVGPDAHTASLFPGDPLVHDRTNIAAAVLWESLAKWRVTLLPGVLLEARQIVMLVGGENKAEAVRDVMEAPYDPVRYPAQIVSHHCRQVTWFLDHAAAAVVSL